MTVLTRAAQAQALRRAAVRATLAPSVRNTQPWRFVLDGDALEVHADPTRRLRVVDPTGRQMLISCGCALFNARVCLSVAGFGAIVERYPDPTRPDMLARLSVGDEPVAERLRVAGIGTLDGVVERTQMNRRRFVDDNVPAGMVTELIAAAAAEGSQLVPITRPEDRLSVAIMSQPAHAQDEASPAHPAVLRAWASDDDGGDGLLTDMGPPRDGASVLAALPIRDGNLGGAGSLPAETRSSMHECLLLLGSALDSPAAWLRVGEAMERTLLEVARRGYAASALLRVIEEPQTRAMLRHQLGLTMQPQVLLRVGRAPGTPATRRRRLVDMIQETA